MALPIFMAVLISLLLCSSAVLFSETSSVNASAKLRDDGHHESIEVLVHAKENFVKLGSEGPEDLNSTIAHGILDLPQNTSEEIGLLSKLNSQASHVNLERNETHSGDGRYVQGNETPQHEISVPQEITNNATLILNFESSQDIFLNVSSNISNFSEAPLAEMNKFDVFAIDSAFSDAKREAKISLFQSVLRLIFGKGLELKGIIENFSRIFSAVPIQPELIESSLISMVENLFHSIDSNFQQYSDQFISNVLFIWANYFNSKPLERRIEAGEYIANFLQDVEVKIEKLSKTLPRHASLNDALDRAKGQLIVMQNLVQRLNISLHRKQMGVGDFISGKVLAQACESSIWDVAMMTKISQTLQTVLHPVAKFIDNCIEDIDASSVVSSIDSELISQAFGVACFYANELPDLYLNSEMTDGERDVPEVLVHSTQLERGLLIEWYKYFDIYFLAERLKELPFMLKNWDLKEMLDSFRKSIRVAWMALLRSEPRDIAVALYGDLLPRGENHQVALRLKCVDLLGELQDFQRSQAGDMEGLIRTLLRRATELECYSLGAADPVLQRLQFLFSMLRAKRNVLFNPFDPLNIASSRMEQAKSSSE